MIPFFPVSCLVQAPYLVKFTSCNLKVPVPVLQAFIQDSQEDWPEGQWDISCLKLKFIHSFIFVFVSKTI